MALLLFLSLWALSSPEKMETRLSLTRKTSVLSAADLRPWDTLLSSAIMCDF